VGVYRNAWVLTRINTHVNLKDILYHTELDGWVASNSIMKFYAN